MPDNVAMGGEGATAAEMAAVLEKQKKAFVAEGAVSAETRVDRINRAIDILVTNEQKICEAISDDFSNRPYETTRFADVAGSINALKDARKHVRGWMKPERRKLGEPGLALLGAKAELRFQPKGVVGLIAPWNFPVGMVFMPLAGILAAGNRCMIKPSEFTPRASALMKELIHAAFDETELRVFTGGIETGAAFGSLAFDHILFTGNGEVGKLVMAAAAKNLTPVTLELGGKSPVFVSRSADLKETATKIMFGKTMNAGQICLAPDYVNVPKDKVEHFVEASRAAVAEMYPKIKDNPDYCSVVDQRQYDRLKGMIQDAKDKGATVVEINPANEDFSQQPHRKIPPTLVLDATDDMKVMQSEIFGPVLPVRGYCRAEEVIDFVNARPRPLALYYFGKDAGEREKVLDHTISGGVTVNDVVMHVMNDDLPFGGVGASGMGSYHGEHGFRTFSHARSVYTQAGFDALAMLRPNSKLAAVGKWFIGTKIKR